MQASTSEKIIAYSALFLSLFAVALSIVEVNNLREQTETSKLQTQLLIDQNKGAVWPEVQIAFTTTFDEGDGFGGIEKEFGVATGDSIFGLLIFNEGMGPAKVQDLFLWVDGTPVTKREAFFSALGVPDTKENCFYARTRDRSFRPGAYEFFFVTADPALRRKMDAMGHKIEVAFCYQSIYNDTWYVKRNLRPSSRITRDTCSVCPWPEAQAYIKSDDY